MRGAGGDLVELARAVDNAGLAGASMVAGVDLVELARGEQRRRAIAGGELLAGVELRAELPGVVRLTSQP